MGRLIDADICLHEAWQNFYKQLEKYRKADVWSDCVKGFVTEKICKDCLKKEV